MPAPNAVCPWPGWVWLRTIQGFLMKVACWALAIPAAAVLILPHLTSPDLLPRGQDGSPSLLNREDKGQGEKPHIQSFIWRRLPQILSLRMQVL